jgi:hypothetical protein
MFSIIWWEQLVRVLEKIATHLFINCQTYRRCELVKGSSSTSCEHTRETKWNGNVSCITFLSIDNCYSIDKDQRVNWHDTRLNELSKFEIYRENKLKHTHTHTHTFRPSYTTSCVSIDVWTSIVNTWRKQRRRRNNNNNNNNKVKWINTQLIQVRWTWFFMRNRIRSDRC